MPFERRPQETKYDVPPDFATPDLSVLADHVEVDRLELSSTHFDTADHRLLAFGLTLRRRSGEADTEWQLGVPGRDERMELRWPAADDALPATAAELLTPFLRGAPVAPVVRLDVARTRHRVRSPSGGLVAEMAHDDVRAVGLAGPVRAPRWHELEMRAVVPDLLTQFEPRLLAAGAFPSTSRFKLARAMLGIGNEGVGGARTSAGGVLIHYISNQVDALVSGHFGLVRDAPSAVHQTRVACRRLRSTLRSFEACFDAEQAVALEDELRWYAGVLGEVRDREVLLRRLRSAVAALPDDLVVGPVPERISVRLRGDLAIRRSTLLETLTGARYADLLQWVAAWRTNPPFTAVAGRPATTLRADVERIERKLAKRLSLATERGSTDDEMHRARKTGKRVRYAAEATGEASALVLEATALQDLLGEFQDSVGAQALLRQLAADAAERGEDGFTYGVLVAEERQRATQAREQAAASPVVD